MTAYTLQLADTHVSALSADQLSALVAEMQGWREHPRERRWLGHGGPVALWMNDYRPAEDANLALLALRDWCQGDLPRHWTALSLGLTVCVELCAGRAREGIGDADTFALAACRALVGASRAEK